MSPKRIKKNKTTNSSPSSKSSGSLWRNSSGQLLNLQRDFSLFDDNIRMLILVSISMGIIGMIWQVVRGFDVESSTYFALSIGMISVLSWMIAREIDPDRPKGAFVAAVIASLCSIHFGTGDLVILFWMMMLLRVINHSTGLSAGLLDNLLIVAVTFWLGMGGAWYFSIFTAVAYLTETQMKNGNPRNWYIVGVSFLLAAISSRTILVYENTLNSDIFIFMIVASILYLPVVKAGAFVRSIEDYSQNTFNPLRMQLTQIFFILMTFLLTWLYGNYFAISLIPLWSVMVGTGLFLLVHIIKYKGI